MGWPKTESSSQNEQTKKEVKRPFIIITVGRTKNDSEYLASGVIYCCKLRPKGNTEEEKQVDLTYIAINSVENNPQYKKEIKNAVTGTFGKKTLNKNYLEDLYDMHHNHYLTEDLINEFIEFLKKIQLFICSNNSVVISIAYI